MALLPAALSARQDDPSPHVDIRAVTVEARRVLSDIGVQRTVLDSVVLRDDVTRTLADVLSQNSSIFIKSYGRATLSTASFRGTAPSHTQVTWNDMSINSPMLGMVDFSLIPSYLIDDADIYHGSSSVGVAGGGLGGAVALSTAPVQERGLGLKYIQGIGSFSTYDQFLRATYSGDRWQGATRVMYSDSDNDFKYRNYKKKVPVYDDNGGQTGEFYYPRERNKNAGFSDLHVLQELYFNTGSGDRFNIAAWFLDSDRGMPMLNTDQKDDGDYRNSQKEQTLRAVAGWDHLRESWKVYARAGYTYNHMRYCSLSSVGNGEMASMINARSYVHTLFGKAGADYYIGEKWLFSGNVSIYQHFVNSIDKDIMVQDKPEPMGYKKNRADMSFFASVRYRPVRRLGLSLSLREELNGETWAPIIPALFAEYSLLRASNLTVKASVSRNYRYPTLNDCFYKPGGNPDLLPEKGVSWDAGVEYAWRNEKISVNGEATYFGSEIRDWILWIPSFKGYWTPVNKQKVRSCGVELKARLSADLGRRWRIYVDANYTVSKSINKSDPVGPDDNSVGKQLVYIPEYSNAVTAKLSWRDWTFTYKYNYYSERYTASDNDQGFIVGRVYPYYMSDVALERSIDIRWCRLNLKVAVNNLFDEEYASVLARPMAGRNYGFFIEITPKLKKRTSSPQ